MTMSKACLQRAKSRWAGEIIGAEAHDIFNFACYPNIGAARVVGDDKTGLVHGGTGHFTVQG